MSASPDGIASCCASAYQRDAVALILGETYHPGGMDLTRRLATVLALKGGERVLDLASGPGTTAFCLASEYGVTVDGVDLGDQTVAKANTAAAQLGFADRVRFHVSDVERVPLGDESVDAVICECAFCLFPDKKGAAREMARVLRPGGRVGITDVTLDPERLNPELASLAGWVACVADARPIANYQQMLETAGLRVTRTEPHDYALAEMIETIDARLAAFSMIDTPALRGIDVDAVRAKVGLAREAVRDGVAGYSLLVARKEP
jgi:ubiquinone/menaquinone biosynthesis C-methylase UbiE